MTDRRRGLPAVDRLLRRPDITALGAAQPHSVLTRAVRMAVDAVRSGAAPAPASEEAWAPRVAAALVSLTRPTLRRVVNATGVVLHTNLGRAPLARAAIAAVTAAAGGYATLEYDAASGGRGSRHVHAAGLLCELTGAADALVVNNAAAALVLAIATLAGGGEVVVSRGELIEIGGGFRIPEIMTTSGAALREVGTTNRTRLADYEKAVAQRGGPRALLKVHRSNFRIAGFTAEADIAELAALGRKKKVPLIYDLGSGLMLDLAAHGLGDEPTLPQAARSGATAVVASGDKLLGGPQAGLLLGNARFIKQARAHPLARAMRADKMTLAALAATLTLYRDADQARREIPVLRMLTAPAPELEARARALAVQLPGSAAAAVTETRAAVGGGSYPGIELASFGVTLEPAALSAAELARRLRERDVPVVATVARGRVVLDVRTLLDGDDALVRDAVAAVLA